MSERCIYCGRMLSENEKTCPFCGADLGDAFYIENLSRKYYNEAISHAGSHDLTGAIRLLKDSLRMDKNNIDARNLLGLVYVETGDYVSALAEWVISANLLRHDNRAAYYLDLFSRPGETAGINESAKKYNQALSYCHEGSCDLARLQLKRLLQKDRNNIRAINLLTLILIRMERYGEAADTVRDALKIDAGNITSLRYQEAIRVALKESGKGSHGKKATVISFQDGNDSVTMPRMSAGDLINGSRSTIINIIIGIGIGLLICFFLVVPTIRQEAENKASNKLVKSNQTATTNKNSISQLQAEVKSLKKELENYTGKADMQSSYEQIIAAQAAVSSGDMDSAKSLLQSVNTSLLGTNAQSLYNSVNAAVNADQLKKLYDAGEEAYSKKDYQNAINNYSQITAIEETYGDGDALYRLGECYEGLQQYDKAVASYQRIVELLPDKEDARKAKNRLNRIQSKTSSTSQNEDNNENAGNDNNLTENNDNAGNNGDNGAAGTDAGNNAEAAQ